MTMRPTQPATPSETPAAVTSGPQFSLRPSKQTAAILGAVIGLCLLAAGGFFVWQQGEIAKVQKEIDAKTKQVNDSQLVASRLDSVKADYAVNLARVGKLETSVKPTEYVPTLLKQIEQLAKSTNLRVDSVRATYEAAPEPPSDPAARKSFTPQPYDKEYIIMQVHGKYWDVVRFLFRTTEFPKILSVDKIDFRPEGGEANVSPMLVVNLNITGYIFKPDENPPAQQPAENTPGGISVPEIPATPALPPRPTI